MKIILFTTILLFSLPSYASQLVPHYSNLKDISCALLVVISSYELKQNTLKGKITKTWGQCFQKSSEWRLWTPVVWDNPDESPIEVSFQEATRRRDFKAGEEIILIQGHAWETFEPTPEMQRKLEYIFNREAYLKEAIKRNDSDELAGLLSDPTSTEYVLSEMTKQKKMSLALALKTQSLCQKVYSTEFYQNYLASITPKERLEFFEALTKDKTYKKLPQAPYRLKDMLVYYMPGLEPQGWKILMENFDSKILDENTEKIYFLRNISKENVDKTWLLKKWIEVANGKADEDVISMFMGDEWGKLSRAEKKSLFQDIVPFLKKNSAGYVFDSLTREDFFFSDPKYAQAISFYWENDKFFEGDSSDSYFFTEKIMKASDTNPALKPLYQKLKALCLKHKKNYPFLK